jgi:hypothetical protein
LFPAFFAAIRDDPQFPFWCGRPFHVPLISITAPFELLHRGRRR